MLLGQAAVCAERGSLMLSSPVDRALEVQLRGHWFDDHQVLQAFLRLAQQCDPAQKTIISV